MTSLRLQHLKDLRASGLNDETIETLEIRSVGEVEASNIVGFGCGPALAFPYPGTNFIRLKPDSPFPIAGSDGNIKHAKYLSPKGEFNRLYVPPAVRILLGGRSERLFITEGEKKAARATQDGFPTLGLVGVWGFRDREHIFIPDLEDICWKGRNVVIVPDSDVASNNHVRDAVWELGWQLLQRDADVRVVQLEQVDGH